MSDYIWYNTPSQEFLERDYLLPGQTLDERVDIICDTAERILNKPGFAKRFKDNIKRGWYSFSTPVWTNFGTNRGLPISCYGTYISDQMESILRAHTEVGMMTKLGGGTSAFFGSLRGRGSPIKDNGESFGSVHFMKLFDTLIQIISQGSTRRGNFAAYLPVDHPDIQEFLKLRSEGNAIQDLSFGICVPAGWMQSMIDGDPTKRQVWARVMECRANTGFPYIMWVDNANAGSPECYQRSECQITHSNLCSEIMLPDSEDESFVCCLSSMNILHYEEWVGTDAVELLVYFLDAVMTEFIQKAELIPYMERAVRFARRHRALGIGWIGWHSFLQSKMLPFESLAAMSWNSEVARAIYEQTYSASEKMATEYGEPEVLKGYGRRHTTLMAIAPTKSSAFILGQVSEGIEPHRSNYYIRDLQKGKFTIKNRELEILLEAKGQNTSALWDDILKHNGSVQHLPFLTDLEKDVFKTFVEISPSTIIRQAGQRQQFIDQSQSLNLMIHPNTPPKEINALLIDAWERGVKSLYYQISVNAAQELGRSILTCKSCES
jgi:ribonucleoside-diphosphate reductase alpha chain